MNLLVKPSTYYYSYIQSSLNIHYLHTDISIMNIQEFKNQLAEFHGKVGTIIDYRELQELGIEPMSVSCAFYRRDLGRLHHICGVFPQIHIVTDLGRRIVNRFVEGDFQYLLANGDKDQSLELNKPEMWFDHVRSVIQHIYSRM
jgi:hypothetical protein